MSETPENTTFNPSFFLTLDKLAEQDDFWEEAEVEYKKAIGEPTLSPTPAPKPKTQAQLAKQQQSLVDSGVEETKLPALPATIAQFASPEVALNLRHSLAQGSRVGDQEKAMYLAHHYVKSPAFRAKVDADFDAGTLNPDQLHRVKFAKDVYASLKDQMDAHTAKLVVKPPPEEEGNFFSKWWNENSELEDMPPAQAAFLNAIDDSVIKNVGIGPNKKLRVSTIQDPTTGKIALDIDKTFPALVRYYTRNTMDSRGVSYQTVDADEMKEISQLAYDKASSDIMAVGQRMRDSIFYDSNIPMIEEIADKPAWERQLDAFSRRKIGTGNTNWIGRKIGLPGDTFGVFNPTVDELAREGTLSWTMRMSLFDFQANKAKMIREVLTKDGTELMSFNDATLYAYAYLNPFVMGSTEGTNDIMRRLGITPEQEVKQFLSGYYHLDEGRAIQGELAAMMMGAFGGSEEDKLKARDETKDSPYSAVAPFVSYMVDPDLITVGLWGFGKAISMGLKFRTFHKLGKFGRKIDELSKDTSIDYGEFLEELQKLDPALAERVHIQLTAKLDEPAQTLQTTDNNRAQTRKDYNSAINRLREKVPEALDTVPSPQSMNRLQRKHLSEQITIAKKEAEIAVDEWKIAHTALEEAKKTAVPGTVRQTGWRTELEPGGTARPKPLTAAEAKAQVAIDARILSKPLIGTITSSSIRKAAEKAADAPTPTGLVPGIRFQQDLGQMKVLSSEIPVGLRKKGIGFELYVQALREAKSKGYSFRSGDGSKTPEVLKIYADLGEAQVPFITKIEEVPGTQIKLFDFEISAEELAKIDLDAVLEANRQKYVGKGTQGPLFSQAKHITRENAPASLFPLFDSLAAKRNAVARTSTHVDDTLNDLKQFQNSLPYGPDPKFIAESLGREWTIKDLGALRKAAKTDPQIFKILDELIDAKSKEVATLLFGINKTKKDMKALYIQYKKQRGLRRGINKSADKIKEYEAQLALENSLSIPFQRYVFLQQQFDIAHRQLAPLGAEVRRLEAMETPILNLEKKIQAVKQWKKKRTPEEKILLDDATLEKRIHALKTEDYSFQGWPAKASKAAERQKLERLLEMSTTDLKKKLGVENLPTHKDLIAEQMELKTVHLERAKDHQNLGREMRLATMGDRYQWIDRAKEVMKLEGIRDTVKETLAAHEATSKVDFSVTPQKPWPPGRMEAAWEALVHLRKRKSERDILNMSKTEDVLGLTDRQLTEGLNAIKEASGPIGWDARHTELQAKVSRITTQVKDARKERQAIVKTAQVRYDHLKALAATGDETAKTQVKQIITKEQETLYRKIMEESRRESKKIKKAEELYIGESALTKLEENYAILNAKRRSMMPQHKAVSRQLESLLAKAFAANPDKLKKVLKARKKALAAPTGKSIETKATSLSKAIMEKQSVIVNTLVKKYEAIQKVDRAFRWRKFARESAEEFKAAQAGVKKNAIEMSVFPKTGLRDIEKNTTMAEKMIAETIKEVGVSSEAVVVMPKMVESIPKVAGTGIDIAIDSQNGIRIAGKLADGQVTISEAKIPNVLKNSSEEARVLTEVLDYAHRNKAALVLEGEAGQLRFRLQAAEVPFIGKGSKWSMSKEWMENTDLQNVQASLEHNSSILEIDGRGLRDKLTQVFGEDAITRTISRNGSDGRLLKEVLDTPNPIRITAREAGALQDDMATSLAHWAERLKPENRELNLAYHMAEASLGFRMNQPGVAGLLAKAINSLVWQFDPKLARLGMASDDQWKILKSGENIFDQYKAEFAGVLRGVSNQDDALERIYAFLDANKSAPLSNRRRTILNSGPLTAFERMKAYVKAAPGEYKTKVGASADLQQLLATANPSVVGISRMWLPRGLDVAPLVGTQLYRAALKNIRTSSSYRELAKKMYGSTGQTLKNRPKTKLDDGTEIFALDNRLVRVHNFGAMAVMWGSMSHDLGRTARKVMGGLMTEVEASDIGHFMNSRYDKIQNVDGMFDTLHALGTTMTEKKARILFRGIVRRTEAMTKEMIGVATGPDGGNILAIRTVRRQLTKVLDGDIKSLDGYRLRDPDTTVGTAMTALRTFLLMQRVAMTRGYGIRSEGHIQFQMIGDHAQMWFEPEIGFRKATQVLFQNEPMTLPLVGRALQDHASEMSKRISAKFGDKYSPLRSLTETIYNPYLNDFWAGKPFFVRVGKDGPIYSGKQIEKAFIEGGVLDTPVSEDLLREAQFLSKNSPLYRKIFKGDFGKYKRTSAAVQRLKNWDKMVEESVIAMQQRQRAGSAIIFMNNGHTLNEAIRLVNKGIYDWKHGISQAELLHFLTALPYYRWFRLAEGQFMRAVLNSLTKPNLDKLANAAIGKTQFNKFRQMYRGQEQMLPIWNEERTPEEVHEEEGYYNALGRAYLPRWMKETYPISGVDPARQDEMDRYAKDGRKISHFAGIHPMGSIVDLAKINMSFPILAAAVYAASQGETAAATDLRIKGTEALTGLLYPSLREQANAYLGVTEYHPELAAEYSPISNAQAKTISLMNGQIWRDPETNKPYANAAWKGLFAAVPLFMGTIPRIVDAAYVKNRGLKGDITSQTKSFLGNYTRWYRTYAFDVGIEAGRRRRSAAVLESALKRKAGLYKD